MSQSTESKNIESVAQAVMGLIDETKINIPDGIYLNICNQLSILKKEEELERKFVKVTFFYTSHDRVDDEDNDDQPTIYDIILKQQTCILRYKKPNSTKFNCYKCDIHKMFRHSLLESFVKYFGGKMVQFMPQFDITSVENI
jgi:hypothetical protein